MSTEHALPLLLRQLRLPTISRHWNVLSEKAQEQHWSYGKFLSELAELELTAREQNRIQRHIREAKLPAGKTLDAFNFKQTASINAAQIAALAETTDWVTRGHNIIIFGPSGVGKTHIASAIGYALIEEGIRVLFSPTTAMVQMLQKAHAEFKLQDAINKLGRYDLLILDDIGYVKKDIDQTSVLFELIAERYETKSIAITSNQPFSEWDSIFSDNKMAVAAIDRLVHHATIVNIQGESYRKANAGDVFNKKEVAKTTSI
jgi:DNA replication protein DnaC